MEDPPERPHIQHAFGDGEKVFVEKSPADDVPCCQDEFRSNEERAKEEVKEGEVEQLPAGTESESVEQNGSGEVSRSFDATTRHFTKNHEQSDIPRVIMLRERVDIFGKVRPMEPEKDIAALQMKPQSIGLIKEAPVKRWVTGQQMWDKKYRRSAEKVIKRRSRYKEKAARLLQHAHEQGVIHDSVSRPNVDHRSHSHFSLASGTSGTIDPDRRWGR